MLLRGWVELHLQEAANALQLTDSLFHGCELVRQRLLLRLQDRLHLSDLIAEIFFGGLETVVEVGKLAGVGSKQAIERHRQ